LLYVFANPKGNKQHGVGCQCQQVTYQQLMSLHSVKLVDRSFGLMGLQPSY